MLFGFHPLHRGCKGEDVITSPIVPSKLSLPSCLEFLCFVPFGDVIIENCRKKLDYCMANCSSPINYEDCFSPRLLDRIDDINSPRWGKPKERT
jgi:hypothetical protein